MNKQEVMFDVRAFVAENFLYMRPGFELRDDDSLMDNGIVDSMGVLELMEFLEQKFGVVVADTDITAESIGTLNAIASYVVRHVTAPDIAQNTTEE